MFKNIKIRYKLFLTYSLVFVTSISLGSLFIYYFVQKTLKQNIELSLNNTTMIIANMLKTNISSSMKNYLRAVAEKNLELARFYYEKQQNNLITEQEAQEKVAEILLNQKIGNSGYVYCLDSRGVVVVHPRGGVLHTDVSNHSFVVKMKRQKLGYIEYDWQNPEDVKVRPKALYMVYFEPWDWIISVSAYRNEFRDLININDISNSIMPVRFGKSGYTYVSDLNGNAVVHPIIPGTNVFELKDAQTRFLTEMIKQKKGKIAYKWKNPNENAPRDKLVLFDYIPEYEWIVASSTYLDELYEPLNIIGNIVGVTAILSIILAIPTTLKISSSITSPLMQVMDRVEKMSHRYFPVNVPPQKSDEIGILTSYLDKFMDQLKVYNDEMEAQILVRKNTEEALRESEERYRSVMEAVPDPVVVYDMVGNVVYLNPAFTRVFGWSWDECKGKKLDHFVPDENWPETNQMIQKVLSGETLYGVKSKRYTKAGNIIHVSISGATYRDRNNNLTGSVIILMDITKSVELEKRVMEIGDMARQTIGQDLHDDLCPQLIGILGLSTVLNSELDDSDARVKKLSENIKMLIENSIEKTRILARGLCPVHMVSHGLNTALKEYIDSVNKTTDASVTYEGIDIDLEFSNTAVTNLYYIAREAVNNAIKHSKADNVKLTLGKNGEWLSMIIEDDGIGIVENQIADGIGMQIMRYRANLIGAKYDIISRNYGGTVVEVLIRSNTI